MSRNNATHLARVLGLGVVLILALHFLGQFSWPQSAAVAVLACLLLESDRDIWRKIGDEATTPLRFVVTVRPKWREILFDHGLVGSEEEWSCFLQRAAKVEAESEIRPSYSLLRDGFKFTVLQQDRDDRRVLIFLNQEGRFSETLDLSKPIPGIEMARPDRSIPLGPDSVWINLKRVPSFIVAHPTWGGYELSLTTPECITANALGSEARPHKLAFLSILEFKWSYEDIDYRSVSWRRFEQKLNDLKEELEEIRASDRWKLIPEEGRSWRLEHRYCTVYHSRL